MTKTDTISIDGQAYDAASGLPVSDKSAAPEPSSSVASPVTVHSSPATSIHGGPQRSVTLHRKALKKPIPMKHTILTHHNPSKVMDISRPTHSNVSRFAPHPVGALKPTKPALSDIGPVTHPHVAKAHARSQAKHDSLSRTITAAEIKDQAIRTSVQNTHKQAPLKSRFRSRQRVVAILSATLAIVLLGGYVTYLNMPALSVRVAAAQAGIDANYPDYRPDGYALNGPVTFSDGKVSMNFKANAGAQRFTIEQSKSGWDSNALLDNYVAPHAGADYIPYTERGLTIYTFGDNAAWVNGGILYTIEGDAPLSSSQMRRIATSLL
ncbi:MAG: hypothetical protein JWO07_366 [Candidatus Saccharibacteria bacterium]|nr:hypothetical protein [Candidatus Saccharibacteria bacterium]